LGTAEGREASLGGFVAQAGVATHHCGAFTGGAVVVVQLVSANARPVMDREIRSRFMNLLKFVALKPRVYR